MIRLLFHQSERANSFLFNKIEISLFWLELRKPKKRLELTILLSWKYRFFLLPIQLEVKFRVQHEIVMGLKYCHVVKRKGVKVSQTNGFDNSPIELQGLTDVVG